MKENKKQKDKTLVIIIIILSILLLGSVSFILYDHLYEYEKNSVDRKENKNDNKQNNKKEEKEKKVTENIKLNISNKINQLLTAGRTYETKEITDDSIPGYDLYSKFLEQLEYDSDSKLLFALHKAPQSDLNTNINSISDSLAKNMISTYGNEVKQISITQVKDIYRLYFGEEINSFKSFGTFEFCPIYAYDEATNSYYSVAPCGGTSADGYILHKEDYQIKNDTLTVRVYLAKRAPIDPTKGMGNENITCGFNCKDIIKTISYQEQFIIDDSNKSLFESYLFTFKEDQNGNYYFSKIEKEIK